MDSSQSNDDDESPWMVSIEVEEQENDQRILRKRRHVFGSTAERDAFVSRSLLCSEKTTPQSILVGYCVRKLTTQQQQQTATIQRTTPKAHGPKETTLDPQSNEFAALIKRFELFRRVVEHEDDLLNQRMSWIILAQSFLMAAFISSNASDGFLYSTAAVGLLTVLVTLPALVAAGKNIEVQQTIYFEGLPSDEICLQLHGHDRDKKWPAIRPRSQLLPNTAFRSKYGVPILTTVVLLSVVQVVGWCCLLVALITKDDG